MQRGDGKLAVPGVPRDGKTELRIPPLSPGESTSLPEGPRRGVPKRDYAELCFLTAGTREQETSTGQAAETVVPLKACTWEVWTGRTRGFDSVPNPRNLHILLLYVR